MFNDQLSVFRGDNLVIFLSADFGWGGYPHALLIAACPYAHQLRGRYVEQLDANSRGYQDGLHAVLGVQEKYRWHRFQLHRAFVCLVTWRMQLPVVS